MQADRDTPQCLCEPLKEEMPSLRAKKRTGLDKSLGAGPVH